MDQLFQTEVNIDDEELQREIGQVSTQLDLDFRASTSQGFRPHLQQKTHLNSLIHLNSTKAAKLTHLKTTLHQLQLQSGTYSESLTCSALLQQIKSAREKVREARYEGEMLSHMNLRLRQSTDFHKKQLLQLENEHRRVTRYSFSFKGQAFTSLNQARSASTDLRRARRAVQESKFSNIQHCLRMQRSKQKLENSIRSSIEKISQVNILERKAHDLALVEVNAVSEKVKQLQKEVSHRNKLSEGLENYSQALELLVKLTGHKQVAKFDKELSVRILLKHFAKLRSKESGLTHTYKEMLQTYLTRKSKYEQLQAKLAPYINTKKPPSLLSAKNPTFNILRSNLEDFNQAHSQDYEKVSLSLFYLTAQLIQKLVKPEHPLSAFLGKVTEGALKGNESLSIPNTVLRRLFLQVYPGCVKEAQMFTESLQDHHLLKSFVSETYLLRYFERQTIDEALQNVPQIIIHCNHSLRTYMEKVSRGAIAYLQNKTLPNEEYECVPSEVLDISLPSSNHPSTKNIKRRTNSIPTLPRTIIKSTHQPHPNVLKEVLALNQKFKELTAKGQKASKEPSSSIVMKFIPTKSLRSLSTGKANI